MNDETRTEITNQVTRVLALMDEEKAAFEKVPKEDGTELFLYTDEPAEPSPDMLVYLDCMTRRIDAELDLVMMLRKVGGVDAE